jgi:hypothetical protein
MQVTSQSASKDERRKCNTESSTGIASTMIFLAIIAILWGVFCRLHLDHITSSAKESESAPRKDGLQPEEDPEDT